MRVPHSSWLLAAVVLLAGCNATTGVALPPGSATLPICPIRTIAVDKLETEGRPDCNLQGSSIDAEGTSLLIGEAGASESTYGGEEGADTISWQMVIWGPAGVAVAKRNESRGVLRVFASTPQARDLMHQQLELQGDEE